jgi:hypothetical protein
MLSATSNVTTANTAVSVSPVARVPTSAPALAPTSTPPASVFSRSTSREPRLRCARAEASDVATIVISEVPTVTCMRTSASMPSQVSPW